MSKACPWLEQGSNVQRKSMRSAEGEEKPPDTLDSIDILDSTDNLPIPYTLYPIPYTLYPIPYNL